MVQRLEVYNTYTGTFTPFESLKPGKVGLYVCGPTVYGPPHLGHARSAITFDIILRYLRHIGYDVCYVRNITDVGHLTNDEGEDKVEKQARIAKVGPMEIAQRYTNSYRDAMRQLNNLRPSIEPAATGHIPEQIALVEALFAKGWAYEVDGSVYFDLQAYQEQHTYGKLSGRRSADLWGGTRSLVATAAKRHPHDFALWKKADPEHLMKWTSPWSEGYPGWHLECTAMSKKYLGQTFDIHGGGLDLCFPHHECEIAQAIAATGCLPARYWLHNNLVLINKQKMSKSANNFITLETCFNGAHTLLSQAYPPMVVRFFTLQAHYRSTLNFSDQALKAAKKGYFRLMNGLRLLDKIVLPANPSSSAEGNRLSQTISQHCQNCYSAMNKDFNTAKVIASLAALRKLIIQLHTGKIDLQLLYPDSWKKLKQTYTTFLVDLLGLNLPSMLNAQPLLQEILEGYKRAKATQDDARITAIRDTLKAQGILLQDHKEGPDWSYEA